MVRTVNGERQLKPRSLGVLPRPARAKQRGRAKLVPSPTANHFVQKRSPAAGQASLPRSLIGLASTGTRPLTGHLSLGRMRIFSRHRNGLLGGVLSPLGPTALEMGARKWRAICTGSFRAKKRRRRRRLLPQ